MIDSDIYKTVLRAATWECNEVDHKAVGGHLPLMKRFSTPMNATSSFTSLQHNNNVPTTSLVQTHNATTTPATIENIAVAMAAVAAAQHRKLDRSLSEPVKQQQQQQQQPTQGNSSRYKTELCRPYSENGFCKYGDKCQFAHGDLELRTMNRHPKYKTEPCKTFHSSGFCPYGHRCHFIHTIENDNERRNSNIGGTSTHQLLSATSSLTLGCGSSNFSNISHYLGSTADSPSPPSSLHASPTIYGNSFFNNDTFNRLQTGQTLVNGLNLYANSNSGSITSNGHISPSGNSNQLVSYDHIKEENQMMNFSGLDTPPVSPVESIAGDMDSLSLSSAPSDSPVPATHSGGALLDANRNRLPIFEQLSEVK